MKACYRIVSDRFAGFEVQKRKRLLFWSYWVQRGHIFPGINTFSSLEEAKRWIDEGCPFKGERKKPAAVLYISEGCK